MDLLQEQLLAKQAGLSYAVITVAESEGTSPCTLGKKMLALEDGSIRGTIGGGELERQVIGEAVQAIKEKKSFFKRYCHVPTHEEPGLGCSFQVSLLVEVNGPGLQLIVCGAGHVGGAVLRLARLLHFETTLIDSRPPEQIKQVIDLADRFVYGETAEEGILKANIPDGAYYLCCMPMHTQDKSALKGALQKRFAYIGMLGSVKKTKDMYPQLEAEGVGRDLLAQVHSPVGLDICDMSPEEVAFSIMAEILMIKNGATGRPRQFARP